MFSKRQQSYRSCNRRASWPPLASWVARITRQTLSTPNHKDYESR
jgi:hypothetical protein